MLGFQSMDRISLYVLGGRSKFKFDRIGSFVDRKVSLVRSGSVAPARPAALPKLIATAVITGRFRES
jgi:hypothetical protein